MVVPTRSALTIVPALERYNAEALVVSLRQKGEHKQLLPPHAIKCQRAHERDQRGRIKSSHFLGSEIREWYSATEPKLLETTYGECAQNGDDRSDKTALCVKIFPAALRFRRRILFVKRCGRKCKQRLMLRKSLVSEKCGKQWRAVARRSEEVQ